MALRHSGRSEPGGLLLRPRSRPRRLRDLKSGSLARGTPVQLLRPAHESTREGTPPKASYENYQSDSPAPNSGPGLALPDTVGSASRHRRAETVEPVTEIYCSVQRLLCPREALDAECPAGWALGAAIPPERALWPPWLAIRQEFQHRALVP